MLLQLLLALLLVQCDARGLNAERLSGVCDAGDCASCFHRPGCGWCAASKQCMPVADADSCARGFSGEVCFAACANTPEVLHDAAGMIQLGGVTWPTKTYIMPNQVCQFNIYPLPESGPGAPGGGQRATVIRLQFEYGASVCLSHLGGSAVVGVFGKVPSQTGIHPPLFHITTIAVDLGPKDSLEIWANGIEGQRILTITGQGTGIVNRVISSRSDSLVLRLTAGVGQSGAGFRAYYRADASPLDLYLISAIVVTSILT